MPFPTVNLLYNLQPGADEATLSDGGKFSLIGTYQSIGMVAAGAEGGYRPKSIVSSLRNSVETKKLGTTALKVTQPVELKNGDLLIVALNSQPGESIGTITPPTGQGWVKIGSLGEATEAGSKRSFGVWWTKVGEGAGEVKVGATMEWTASVSGQMTAIASAIMLNTWNLGVAIDAEGTWVKAAASTTPAFPTISSPTPENRAMAIVSSGSGTPKTPTGAFLLSESSVTISTFTATDQESGTTGEGTYVKSGTKETWCMIFTIRPVYGDGAYWNVETFKNPAIAIKVSATQGQDRSRELLACLANPGTTEPNGYVLKVIVQTGGVNVKYEIFKMTKGVRTLLVASGTTARPAVGDLIGMTVTAGVIAGWKKVGAGAWTTITEVSDSTYTEGYVGFAETTGTPAGAGRFINFEAAAQVHEHTLSVTQGQSPTKAVALTRALSTTQAQTPTRTVTPARILTPSAATQVASLSKTPGKVLSATQAQIANESAAITKLLAASQAQAISRSVAISKTLTISATQVASKQSAIARTLSTTQPQTPSVSRVVAHTFTTTQSQVATRTATVGRILTATQGQAITRRAAVSRALSVAATSAASFVRALARTLRTSQGQTPTMTETVEKGAGAAKETLSASQGQTATVRKVVARTLTTSQSSSPTLARSLTHSFTAANATVASIKRALGRTLRATTSQTATLTAVQAHTRPLPTTQTSVATLRRAVSRTLRTSTAQNATISSGTIEVPLPPPVKMSASTSGDTLRSSTGGHHRLTSSARTP